MPSSPGDLKSAQTQSPPPASSTSNSPFPAVKPLKANQTLNGLNSPSNTGGSEQRNSPSPSPPQLNSLAPGTVAGSATKGQPAIGGSLPLAAEQLAGFNSSSAAAAVATSSVRQISKLKRFLTTLHQFSSDISTEVGERVHALVTGLVNSTITIEDFHQKIQDITHYPLRPYVIPFLRLHLPILQNEIMHFARLAKLTPAQYIRQHESLILDTVSANSCNSLTAGEPFEIFQPTQADGSMGVKEQSKRRLSPEARKENGYSPDQDQSTKDNGPPAKRHHPLTSPLLGTRHSPAGLTPALLHTPVSMPLGHHPNASTNPSLLHSHLSTQARALFEAEARERDRDASVPTNIYHGNGNGRDPLTNGRNHGPGEHFERERYAAERYEKEYYGLGRSAPIFYSELQRNYNEELARDMEDEWKNIHTMLNCILGMVEKTKRALAILQHRSLEQVASTVWSPPGRARHFQAASHDPAADYHKKARPDHHGPVHYSKPVVPAIVEVDRLSAAVTEALRRPRPPPPVNLTIDPVNEVKRQAVAELQKAVSAAESKASELVAAERAKMERILGEARRQAAEDALTAINHQEDNTENCWNCGRKANETCSGCNVARYCGAYCQHKDWETHHRICGQTRVGAEPVASTNGLSATSASVSPTSTNTALDLKSRAKSSPSPTSSVTVICTSNRSSNGSSANSSLSLSSGDKGTD